MVAAHSPLTTNTSNRILYTYDTTVHGFAVRLTSDEARHMSMASGVTGILCNNKLLGAKAFSSSADAMAGTKGDHVPSPRDKDGHGTHVSSIAAGSEVPNAGMYMFSRGTTRGMAPKARIAMYKACDTDGCSSADVAAAVETAVKDGVDILSMSLGVLEENPFYDDIIAVSAFGAERNGIFVTMDGSNYGPGRSTVGNVAPWMMTVGAATMDRMFPANLTLGNGVVLNGQSLYTMQAEGTGMIQLMYSYCLTESENWLHENVEGKIMVCLDRGNDPDVYGFLLQKAGGSGIVFVDFNEWSRDGTSACPFTLPGLTLGFGSGERLKAYMASEANPVASFSFSTQTIIQENQAPMVAGFSARGPNPVVPELLKPDIVAPGVNILGGWSHNAPLYDGRRVDYNIISGTSMATPHVAGIAALIKKKYPGWTPAMIRSALMTTAGTLDNRGHDILDNGAPRERIVAATPLVTGSGHVRPNLALDPGLIYDAGESDYIDFMCTLNYTAEQLRLLVPDFTKCTRTLPGGPADLNYPSFVVIFDNRTNIHTLTRTVTVVSGKAETYKISYVVPERVKVSITPTTLVFKKPNERKSYTAKFRSLEGNVTTDGWDFGHISWENKEHVVRSPVAFQWKN
ncbi:hypothetical protein QOZ80_7AG0574470 [Eleusine coracana subsp. coracana]|nr:hypothetical protein QOZ80_7AG0574470 [Eleusine coracana subsp. coracana]